MPCSASIAPSRRATAPAQFEGSATGAWGAPLRLKARISGTGLEAEAEGSAEPWAQEASGSFSLKVGRADFGPLLDLKPADTLAQNIGLTSRVSLAGNRLTFDDLDSSVGGSRLRGRIAVTLGEEKEIEGEIGAEQLALGPALALALGAAGHDAAEPLGTGLAKGWRGRIAFQALRGLLPGGSELQPVSGIIKSDGQSLTFDAIQGKIGGGEVTASMDAKPGANGIALNASVQFSGVDGTALRYRNLAMPAGRASMQMTLNSQGRSASALAGALSGSGTLTLEAARISGLDPRAFEVAVRANDSGQAKDDVRLKQIVESALPAGALAVPSAQIPFTVRDGRLRVGATTLDGNGVRATVSGGYDIAADQADIRAALSLTMTTGRPEIQLLAVGTPDALTRSVDVAPLSSWLAVRAIDHETRRLDAIERGEPPPPAPPPIVLPADGQAPIPEAVPSAPVTQKSGRDRRHSGEKGDAAASARRQCAACTRRRPAARCAAAAADRREARAGPRRAETASAAGADAADRQSAAALQLGRFPAKWSLVRVKKTLQIKNLAEHDLAPDSDRLQKRLVMADGDQRAVESFQRIFQLFDGSEIEMVGRLVQQQEERRLRACEYAGEARAKPLAARERGGDLQRRPVTERKPRQRGVGLVGREFRIQAAQIFENARAGIEQADMLIEHGNAIGEAADRRRAQASVRR